MHGATFVPLYETTASLHCKVGALGGKSKHLVSCKQKNEHCIFYIYIVVVHAVMSWEKAQGRAEKHLSIAMIDTMQQRNFACMSCLCLLVSFLLAL